MHHINERKYEYELDKPQIYTKYRQNDKSSLLVLYMLEFSRMQLGHSKSLNLLCGCGLWPNFNILPTESINQSNLNRTVGSIIEIILPS